LDIRGTAHINFHVSRVVPSRSRVLDTGRDHFEKLFPLANFNIGGLKISGKYELVLIAALVILLMTCLRSMGLLTYVSMGGVLASGVVVGCLVWAGDFNGLDFMRKGGSLTGVACPLP